MSDLSKKQEDVLEKLSRRNLLGNATILATVAIMLFFTGCAKERCNNIKGQLSGNGIGCINDTTKPPHEIGTFKASDLVELVKLDTSLHLDIRYATSNNLAGRPIYEEARAFLQRPAAEALVEVNEKLKSLGFGLLIFDGYRPWFVTKFFWDITPDENKKFVANPKEGSRHNRGCAVDLSLYEVGSGKEVQMTGQYDEMSERSYPTYTGGTAKQRKMRDLLRSSMEAYGFTVYEYEWWHFDFKDWQLYRIENIPFSEIK